MNFESISSKVLTTDTCESGRTNGKSFKYLFKNKRVLPTVPVPVEFTRISRSLSLYLSGHFKSVDSSKNRA